MKKLAIITSAAIIAGGIAVAVLLPSNADKNSTWNIYKKNSDSTLSQVKKQKYANNAVLKQLVTVLQTSRLSDSSLIAQLDYSAPVPVDSNSFPVQPVYQTSAAVSYSGRSNFTISGLSIKGGQNCIMLSNCQNVVINNCRLEGAKGYEIYLTNCKNVQVIYNFITGGVSGVHVENSSSIKVNHNQILNINGPYPGGNYVQFVNISKGSINYNRCQDINGVAQHPQDGLSVYKSNGAVGDSIQVIGNYINGGQNQNDSGGAAAIVLGDVGGSYQVGRGNKIVNGGFVGAQVQGGSNIKFDHNLIYSAQGPYNNDGLSFGNYSGVASANVEISYNRVNFTDRYGKINNWWFDSKTAYQPKNWSTNIADPSLNASILPTPFLTWK